MNKIELWENVIPYANQEDSFIPFMETYLLDTVSPVGAVLICPGGGYGARADHEGRPIAEFFNSKGFHAFVVQYRVSPNRHPAPLADVTRAMRIIRSSAEKWNLKADKIAVCGFSAGGHLTGSIGVHYDLVKTEADSFCGKVSARPDALILCYPVISSKSFPHAGSFENLLGKNYSDAMRDLMSLEDHVTAATPPSFLWHTAEDPGVPVENSLQLCSSLSRFNIPFELHVFPKGRHGLGLAPESPEVAVWSELCATWLKNMNWGE
jgi:acetyl esterase/lipase